MGIITDYVNLESSTQINNTSVINSVYNAQLIERNFLFSGTDNALYNPKSVVLNNNYLYIAGATNYGDYSNTLFFRLDSSSLQYDSEFNYNMVFQLYDPFNAFSVIDLTNRIYFLGGFLKFQGQNVKGVIRLDETGNRDLTFDVSSGFNGDIYDATIDINNRFYVSGQFTSYQGQTANGIVRLTDDGTLDASFNTGIGFSSYVFTIDIDKNNNIYVGGGFTSYKGQSANRIICLNEYGAINASFNIGSGFNDVVNNIKADDVNNKIYVCGDFTSYRDQSVNKIVRLNYDGTLDASFNTNFSFLHKYQEYISVIYYDNDINKIYIGGDFYVEYNDTSVFSLIRLNYDGTLDTSFQPEFYSEFEPADFDKKYTSINSITLDKDRNILYVGGTIYNQDDVEKNTLVCLDASTGKYYSVPINIQSHVIFDSSGISYYDNYANENINNKRWLPDKEYVDTVSTVKSGDFLTINNKTISLGGYSYNEQSLIYYNVFDTSNGFNNTVYDVFVDASNKVYVVGRFTTYRDSLCRSLICLDETGNVDTSFDVSSGLTQLPIGNNIILDSSNKIYVGGRFTSYYGVSNKYIIRINANGTPDTSFDVSSGFNNTVYSIAIDSSNKIYVGGIFTSYKGQTANRIIRLNYDGTIDNSFDVSLGFNNTVYSIAIDSSNKIYVGGWFTSYRGQTANRIIRLNYDGTIDNSFDVSSGFNNTVYSIAIDSSNKIYVGGWFTSYRGQTANRIIRLNYNGTIDASFNYGLGFNNYVSTIVINPSNNKIYVGGYFTEYNNNAAKYLARLNYNGSIDTSFDMSTGLNGNVNKIFLKGNNIYVGGSFTKFRTETHNRFIVLNTSGNRNLTPISATSMSINKYGFSYASDYSSINTSNQRWIPDKQYVDLKINEASLAYVLKSGSIMTGSLTINTSLNVKGSLYADNSVGWTGTFTSDGSIIVVKNGIIVNVI